MKAKTRKSNFRYFYKSKETGNVWPSIKYYPNSVIDFVVAGTSYRDGLGDYVGEFMGRLVPEPDNEYDSQAIRVEHSDGHHIGYVPKDKTQEIRDFKGELPCDCYCLIQKGNRSDFWAKCFVSEYPMDE